MLKKIFIGCIIIIIVLLQTTFFQFISINNVSPNLFIITIVSVSALRGRNEGLVYAIGFGFIQDVLFGNVVGFYILIYAVIAYLTGYLYQNYYAESIILPLSVVGASDFMYNFLIYIFTFLFRGRLDFVYYLVRIILPEITYTVVMAVLFYRLFFAYYTAIDNFEKEKQKKEDDFNERFY